MKAWKKGLKYFVPLLPAIVGFYGFMHLQGMTVSWALYYTVRLFGLNTDVSDLNIFIEIARWTAPISIAGVLIMTIKILKERIITFTRSIKRDCCSVYGNSPEALDLLHNLGKSGIVGNSDRVRSTPYHVLMFTNDQDTMEFYAKHENELRKYKVYLSLERNQTLNLKYKNVFTFSMADNCAIQYWKNHLAESDEKIAMIGDDELTDSLLFRGLLSNITALDQHIEYHIWKKECSFPYLHSKISKINMDKLCFHEHPYYQEVAALQQMNRIILCGQESDNLQVLAKLSEVLLDPVIHIKMRSKSGIETIYGNSRVEAFGTSTELTTREVIIKESLLNGARELHNSYYNLYGGKQWEELEPFKKQANLFSAEYSLTLGKLYKKGTDKEILSELVHECWCRFHYLNGWEYAEKRDDSKKLHNLLLPYDKLSEEEKQKDRDIVEKAI